MASFQVTVAAASLSLSKKKAPATNSSLSEAQPRSRPLAGIILCPSLELGASPES